MMYARRESLVDYLIVVMHHHPVSRVSNGEADGRILREADWHFEDLGVDLIVHGHTHTAQFGTFAGVPILDVSNCVRESRNMSASQTTYGSRPHLYQPIWQFADPGRADGPRVFGRLSIKKSRMALAIVNADTGAIEFEMAPIKS